ncbi:MAG: family 10 glycosylhydrolase, partial [Candidatus Limnocylindria bacterium]
MRRNRGFLLGVALLVGLSGALLAPTGRAVAAGEDEFRAYWVDAFGEGIFTRGQIDELVAAAKEANFNALVVQVGRRGDCFCNSAIMPRTQAFIDPLPYDPLQTLIDKAHAAGIEVHAWIIATAIW